MSPRCNCVSHYHCCILVADNNNTYINDYNTQWLVLIQQLYKNKCDTERDVCWEIQVWKSKFNETSREQSKQYLWILLTEYLSFPGRFLSWQTENLFYLVSLSDWHPLERVLYLFVHHHVWLTTIFDMGKSTYKIRMSIYSNDLLQLAYTSKIYFFLIYFEIVP